MKQEKIPVQFIRCTEEQICSLREQSKVSKNEMKNFLSLVEDQKEPEENPIENLIKELEKI